MSLREYKRKRDFTRTAEPSGDEKAKGTKGSRFVIQKHAATRLHYDFRLEIDGVLVSWAVPKGLPMTKGEKHLAVKVEDHPLSYIDFEGTIPKGQYGGGTVQVWDRGTYQPLASSWKQDLKKGKLHLTLHGEKLHGEWYLVELRDEDQWLIIRGGDDHKKLSKKVEASSALSGKTMDQLAITGPVWNSRTGRSNTGKTTMKSPAKSKAAKTKISMRPPKPLFIEPMKAKAADTIPHGAWSYEIKFDGFRALACMQGSDIQLLSRTNNDMAEKFPEIVEALAALRSEDVIVDGEIVALDKKGRSSFQALQAYELGQEKPPLCFYAFDILSLDGRSTRDLPIEERREKLRQILPESTAVIRFSDSLGDDAKALLKKVASLGLEGLIGKRSGSRYEVGKRTGSWIKLKIVKEQEFVIGGFTDPAGSRKLIGAILVGVHDEKGRLIFSGKVGTGFNEAVLRDLYKRFDSIATDKCPFVDLPQKRTGRYGQGITAAVMKRCHWVKPLLVCQIKFSEWTRDSRLRQPVYLGLREDKSPRKVIREPESLT